MSGGQDSGMRWCVTHGRLATQPSVSVFGPGAPWMCEVTLDRGGHAVCDVRPLMFDPNPREADPQPPVSDEQHQMGVERATDGVLNIRALFGEVRVIDPQPPSGEQPGRLTETEMSEMRAHGFEPHEKQRNVHRPIGYDDDGTPFDCKVCGAPWPCAEGDLLGRLEASLPATPTTPGGES